MPLPLPLLQLVKEVVNPDAEIVFRENTADDPSRRRPDITKMKNKYGWQPQVPLREGLALMVDDFKKRLHVE
jgi:UDP-glucuronate decarboxylase